MSSVRTTLIILTFLSTAFAQTPSSAPAFEVAVIKPSLPMAEAMPLLMQGKLKVGISIDKARVDMRFVTLTDLIVEAYKIKPHQISGPDWLSMERFDIQAKLPDGAAVDQTPQMLQAMLAGRFGLRTHTESRAEPAYALMLGKNRAKLLPSRLPSDAEPSKGLASMTPAAGGKLTSSGGPAGPVQMAMGPDGIQLVMLKTKIAGLADLLSSICGKPVVDRTGLNGDYQISLDIPQSDVQIVARALGMGGAGGAASAAGEPAGSSMFQAVEQLGLRLEPRKEQIDKLVIDHIEKQPTTN